MAASEHLLVLFSIVLGLGLTELLSSLHHLLHPDTKTKWHWLPVYWAGSVFSSLVFWWWVMFEFGRVEELPNFFGIMLILLGPVMLYLLATSALPDITPGDTVDLQAFYIKNRRRFFGLAAGFAAVTWLQMPLLGGEQRLGQHVWMAMSLLLLMTLARTSNGRVHEILSGLSALMFIASVTVYWLRIG